MEQVLETSDKLTRNLFSYSTDDHSKLQKAVIRTIEFLGGQPKLWRLYLKQQIQRSADESFFDAAIRLLDVDVKYSRDRLNQVPKKGPVLFVANHPYGVLDGIVLTWLAIQVRPDVKVLANSVLDRAPEVRSHLLPIDFAPTRRAMATSIRSRNAAMQLLQDGGAVGIFPGGGVSTAAKPVNGPALDLPWIPYTAKLIQSTKATVVPIYFNGQNSRLFQIASHLSPTLRLSLMFHETVRRMGTPLQVKIGDPIAYDDISNLTDKAEMTAYLRRKTFALAGRPDIDWMSFTELPA